MAIIVDETGSLNDNWHHEYIILKNKIISFCQEEYQSEPLIAANYYESVEIDLEMDNQPLIKPGEDYEWKWRVESLELLVQEACNMIEFADSRFSFTISRLKDLVNQLNALIKLIP